MTGFLSPSGGEDDDLFREYGGFDPDGCPTPGRFLADGELLTGVDHASFHETTRDLFEERGVYDVTFGYNLARLNLDTRHPDAGYRYAEEPDDPSVLRAEFTPTTPFCPQSTTLTKASFRAWNALSDRHEYDLVRVRVDEGHHRSDEINETLSSLEADYRKTGSVTGPRSDSSDGTAGPTGHSHDADAPF